MTLHIFLLFNECRLTWILQIRTGVDTRCLLHSLEHAIFILLNYFSPTTREISAVCYLSNCWEEEKDPCRSPFEDMQNVNAAV